jgi:hypothetical protein
MPPKHTIFAGAKSMSHSVRIARRIFLAGAASTLCSACNHSYLADMGSFVRANTEKGKDLTLTLADIQKIPYASIAARIGEGSQALLILGSNLGDDRHWISADHEVLVTRHGRIVETEGLLQDVRSTTFFTPDPIGGPSSGFAANHECVRSLDIEPYHHDGIVVRSRFESGGGDEIEILGNRIPTQIWWEHGGSTEYDWRFVNQYWIDPESGFVWKSLQASAPALSQIEITVYRRPV